MKGNAQIKSTHLGYEEHGMLTCWINLSQESFNQSFGGYVLDAYDKKLKVRVPTIYAGFWIARVLATVGVGKWEELNGKYVRVDGEDFGDILGIGHITDDKWFFPRKEIDDLMANDGRIDS